MWHITQKSGDSHDLLNSEGNTLWCMWQLNNNLRSNYEIHYEGLKLLLVTFHNPLETRNKALCFQRLVLGDTFLEVRSGLISQPHSCNLPFSHYYCRICSVPASAFSLYLLLSLTVLLLRVYPSLSFRPPAIIYCHGPLGHIDLYSSIASLTWRLMTSISLKGCL